jgi:hypothetical protein
METRIYCCVLCYNAPLVSNDKTDRFLNSENSEILSKTASHKNEAHHGSGHIIKAHPLSLLTADLTLGSLLLSQPETPRCPGRIMLLT